MSLPPTAVFDGFSGWRRVKNIDLVLQRDALAAFTGPDPIYILRDSGWFVAQSGSVSYFAEHDVRNAEWELYDDSYFADSDDIAGV